MSRAINTAKIQRPAIPGKEDPRAAVERPDDYKQKLYKYIPAEVIALYLTFDTLLRAAGEEKGFLPWLVCGFCFLGTPLYLCRVAGVKRASQLAVSTVAFAVWAFALGGPFAALSWYRPIYGGLLLPAYTFLIPIFGPGQWPMAKKKAAKAAG